MHEECMFFPPSCDMSTQVNFGLQALIWASLIYSKAMRQSDLTVT